MLEWFPYTHGTMHGTVFVHTGLNARHPFSIHMSTNMSQCKATLAVQILNDQEARFNSADLNIAYKMNVDEYQKLCPYSGELEANWGKAPGTCPAPTMLVPAWLLSMRCPMLRCCCAAACNGCTVLLSSV